MKRYIGVWMWREKIGDNVSHVLDKERWIEAHLNWSGTTWQRIYMHTHMCVCVYIGREAHSTHKIIINIPLFNMLCVLCCAVCMYLVSCMWCEIEAERNRNRWRERARRRRKKERNHSTRLTSKQPNKCGILPTQAMCCWCWCCYSLLTYNCFFFHFFLPFFLSNLLFKSYSDRPRIQSQPTNQPANTYTIRT